MLKSTKVVWPSIPAEPLWLCSNYPSCDSYVRTHPGTTEPLGTLAGPKLRRLRGEAHRAFDPLWRDSGGSISREAAYRAAGQVLCIVDFHIGFLNEAGCRKLLLNIADIDEALTQQAELNALGARVPPPGLLDIFAAATEGSVPLSGLILPSRTKLLEPVMSDLISFGMVTVAGDAIYLTPFGQQLLD